MILSPSSIWALSTFNFFASVSPNFDIQLLRSGLSTVMINFSFGIPCWLDHQSTQWLCSNCESKRPVIYSLDVIGEATSNYQVYGFLGLLLKVYDGSLYCHGISSLSWIMWLFFQLQYTYM